MEVLTNPQAHPTQAQLKAVKTGKAHQKIHAWLCANDSTFIDREALAKREAEIAANTLHSHLIAEQRAAEGKHRKPKKREESDYTGLIRIEDSTNFLVTIAQCCSPEPGDPIVGYVSRTRGITVHCASCLTFLRIPDIEHRTVQVEWDVRKKEDAAAQKSAADPAVDFPPTSADSV